MPFVGVGDQPQQRGLADAVGADEGYPLTIRDFEGDLVEESPATGKRVADLHQLDKAHATRVRAPTPTLPRTRGREILRRGLMFGSVTLRPSASSRRVQQGAG